MYNAYFRFAESPFSIAPDPRFVFMSARHREALAHLMYGLTGEGGFVVLTGEVGTGKTTICRCMLEQVPKDCDVAFMLNPGLSAVEMLGAICYELHIAYPDGLNIKGYVDRFNNYLLKANASGRRTVVIIDEAQLLDPKVLELLRLLTNLETSRRKLLQIVLLGQPELVALLERPDLRQVAQRIVARYHLQHLSRIEVSAYVAHRLNVAGCQARLIPESLIGALFRYTSGVPRLINLVCDRALLGAYVEGKQTVTAPILRKAAAEVFGTSKSKNWKHAPAIAAMALSVLLGAWLIWKHGVGEPAGVPLKAAAEQAADSAKPDVAAAAVASSSDPGSARVVATAPRAETAAAVVTAPPSPPPAKAAQLELPKHASAENSEAEAYRALLVRFGMIYSPHGKLQGCAYAASVGLRCFAGKGNTEILESYNPPMLLYLQKDSERHAVVLDSRDGRQATFVVGGRTQTAPVDALDGLWTGEFLVFWRPPPGMPKQLQAGASGAPVRWLGDALDIVSGTSPSQGTERFDAALEDRVKRFQAAEGLDPDGIAGPLTLLRLGHRVEARLARARAADGAN